MRPICLVLFKDLLEENSTPHFGILLDDESVICLCCGGILEPEDREIIQKFNGFSYLDETLKEYYLSDEEKDLLK